MSAVPTLEKMRSEVAKALGVDVEEIGLDDHLPDLGLDSIRAMLLARSWSGDGVRVDFASLAERPTLRAWHALMAASDAGAGGAADG